jgi:hypothetical protein
MLEDILEEIVGQIADEHDTHEAAIRPQPDGTVNVDGTVAIRDLNRQMNWNLPDEEATTVAGLVIHEAQTIPGTSFVLRLPVRDPAQDPQQDHRSAHQPGGQGRLSREARRVLRRLTAVPRIHAFERIRRSA